MKKTPKRAYGPTQTDNAVVNAILDGEMIVGLSTRSGNDASALFDPVWSPAMHALADRVMKNLRGADAARSAGSRDAIDYQTFDDGVYDPDDPNDAATLIHFVGSANVVYVCKGRPGYFAEMLRYAGKSGACDLQVTQGCGGEVTSFIPLQRGHFLLIFECCIPCREHAGQLADGGYIQRELQVRGGLPRGARIMRNPETDDSPDAWA